MIKHFVNWVLNNFGGRIPWMPDFDCCWLVHFYDRLLTLRFAFRVILVRLSNTWTRFLNWLWGFCRFLGCRKLFLHILLNLRFHWLKSALWRSLGILRLIILRLVASSISILRRCNSRSAECLLLPPYLRCHMWDLNLIWKRLCITISIFLILLLDSAFFQILLNLLRTLIDYWITNYQENFLTDILGAFALINDVVDVGLFHSQFVLFTEFLHLLNRFIHQQLNRVIWLWRYLIAFKLVQSRQELLLRQ